MNWGERILALAALWILVAPVGIVLGPDKPWFIALTLIMIGPFVLFAIAMIGTFFLSILIYGDERMMERWL